MKGSLPSARPELSRLPRPCPAIRRTDCDLRGVADAGRPRPLAFSSRLTIYAGTVGKVQVISDADSALSIRGGFRHVQNPAALGWTRITAPVLPWLLDAGAPGSVDGPAVAGTLISSLRADKVKSPARLSVATAADGYAITWGLGLGQDFSIQRATPDAQPTEAGTSHHRAPLSQRSRTA